MAIRLKQSTASQEVPLGPFLDSTDGATPETGLTIANTDIKLWAMGATSLANKNSGGATHMAGGIYYCTLDATDTATLGALVIFINVAGALPIKVEFEVVAANVYDALVGGTDLLQVDVTEWKGATAPAMTGDAFARLGAPAGASHAADLAAVKADTAATLIDTAEIGAAGAGLTALASAANLATVDTVVDAIKAKTDNLPSDPADQSLIIAATNTILADTNAIKVVTDKLDDTLEDDGGTYRFTANALEQGPSGGGGVVADWTSDERAAIRSILGIPASGTTPDDPTAGILDTIRDSVATRASQTSVDDLPTNAELSTALGTADDAVLTQVALVKAKTDLIPAAPAAVGDVPSAASNAAAVLAATVEGSVTVVQSLRLANAVLGGKASGLETTSAAYRDLADTKTRITATVDEDGNRSAVTRDLT